MKRETSQVGQGVAAFCDSLTKQQIPDLIAGDFPVAVLADSGSFFDDFRTERAFPCKKSLMDSLNRRVQFFLNELISHLQIFQRFNGFQVSNIADHLGCF